MLERIRQNLALETQETSMPENLTPAAVLFPLLLKDNNLHVLFTKRTQTVKAHKGQVSFPGGVRDPHDENLLATALREAQEEIDLKPEDVEILGQADATNTVVSNFIVHPFVGVIPYPYDFIISSDEVDRIIQVPFRVFFENDPQYRQNSAEFEGVIFPGSAFKYKGDVIWGATARILVEFMGILEGRLDLRGEAE